MISYGDMLDTIEKNTPQETTVAEKKGGDVPEKKYGDNAPEKKDVEPEKEVDDSEDVI